MCKILLVEDDLEISVMLQNFLKTEQFQVIPYTTGKAPAPSSKQIRTD